MADESETIVCKNGFAVITTSRGLMDSRLLRKTEDVVDNDNEFTTVTQYWFDGEAVHRSVHVKFKRSPGMTGVAASMG